MSGISSGVGLISGLPVDSIINQLIAIESRPLFQLQARIQRVKLERGAFAQLSARLLGLKSVADRFDESVFFNTFRAVSGAPDVLTASASQDALTGTFQFRVRSLASNHQLVTRGFANADRQSVGTGTLTLEMGHGRLNVATQLNELNGGDGVRRGSIEITDSAGDSATIDLAIALTVEDVLEAINSERDLQVFARAEGDHLVIEDRANGPGVLSVSEVRGGHTAADLGIAGQGEGDHPDMRIDGERVLFLADGSQLEILNDGTGVSVGKTNEDIEIAFGSRTFTVGLRGVLAPTTALSILNSGNGVRGGTFRITNRAGDSAEVVIDDSIETIGDVLAAINGTDLDVRATTANGQIQISDDSTPDGRAPGNLKIEDVSGHAAQDMGIVADTDQASFLGNEIYRVASIGDVIRAINFATDQDREINDVIRAEVSSNGRGIELTRLSGNEEFTVSAASGAVDSEAAKDLGLIGTSVNGIFVTRDVLAGMNTTLLSSLNGGSGVATGEIRLKSADGVSQALVDLSGAATVQDIIDRINAVSDDSRITARLNSAGNGIMFEDTSGVSGTMKIKDITGTTIRDLLRQEAPGPGVVISTDGRINTGNVQLRYVSRTTSLDALSNGRGIGVGAFRITARNGQAFNVNVTENQHTVGQIIDLINNNAVAGLTARINGNGDGIEIVDETGGAGNLKIADVGGATTARNLNIAGEGVNFAGPDNETHQRIDGSFEYRVEIDADDTLEDVREKVNALGIDVTAAVLNDGARSNPFRLVLTSGISGSPGELVLDAGTTGLATETLARAQDAVVLFGGGDAGRPLVLTSSTNVLDGAITGVSINLVGTSEEPTTLSVEQDIEQVVSDLSTFVSSYNAVLNQIDDLTSFDPDTNARGTLFGDSTVELVRNRLRRAVSRTVPAAPAGFDRLTFVGIRVQSGGRLSFDESKFREVYAANPEAIETLFTDPETGLGVQLSEMLDGLTRSFDGILARKDDTLNAREEIFNDRVEALADLLDRKRARLERQFQGLESSLLSLQAQQGALSALSLIGATQRL